MLARVWFGLWWGGCQGCVQATLLSMQVTPSDTEPRSGGAHSALGSVLGTLQQELVRSLQCSREAGVARFALGSVLGTLQQELVRSSQCSHEQVVPTLRRAVCWARCSRSSSNPHSVLGRQVLLDEEVPISNKLDKCAV